MKKIFSLFALVLLSCMGAWAGSVEPATGFTGYSAAPSGGAWAENTQWFMIQNLHSNGTTKFYLAPTGNYLPQTLPTAATIDSYLWALVGDAENGFQLYNKAQGPNSVLWANGSSRGMSAEPTDAHVWDLYTSLAAGKYLFIEHGTEHNAFNNGGQEGRLVTWNNDGALYGWKRTAENPAPTGDDGSNFVISGAEDFTVVVNGLTTGGGVVIAGENHGAGAVSTFGILAEAATAIEVEGYDAEVHVNGNMIIVIYNEHIATFPEAGTYYVTIENKETVRMPFLYNDISYSDDVTLQAQTAGAANGYIWKVVSDGNGNVTVKNAENGKGIKATGKCTGIMDSFRYTNGVTAGYYNLINTTLIGNGHDRLNCANSNAYCNEAGLRAVTTWTGAHTDNDWRFNVVPTEGLSEYTISVSGANGYVTFGDKKAANGGFFLASSIAKADLTASEVLGYEPTITIDGTDINVEYTLAATPVNVTYNIYVEGVKVGEEVFEEFDGEATAYRLNAPEYVNVSELPATVSATSVDVYTTYKDGALPFKLDETAYNLQMNRANKLTIYYDPTVSETDIQTRNSTHQYVEPVYATQDYYKWVFGGNWYTGYTIKNVGTDKYITFGAKNVNSGTHASFVETPDEGAYFELRKKGGFNYFRVMGTTNGTYLSNNGGDDTTYLTTWASENNYNNSDAGAQIIITEAVEIPEPARYDWDAFETKLAKIQQHTFGEGLGQYAEVDLTEYDYHSVYEALYDIEMALNGENEALYDDDMEVMDKILANLHLNMPKAGDLLVIQGATTGKYVYADATAEANNGASTQLAQGDLGWPNDPESYDKWASAIFYFDGEHLISYNSPSGSGFYVFRSGLSNNPAASKDVITFHEGSKVGCYRIHTADANSNWYDYYGSTGRINRWSANDAELTNFVLEYPPYDYVHIGSAGYATVCLPVDVAWEYGESGAYTVNEVDGVLKATPISGCIPAGVPAVITGESGNYILKPAGRWASADAEQFTTNVLRGTYAAMEKPENALVFNVVDEVPGFYGYTGTYLNGFKAYYENPAGASNLRINFEGTLTAIESAVEAAQGHQLFDLQGRRVNGAAHGLFIQNGKKVIK